MTYKDLRRKFLFRKIFPFPENLFLPAAITSCTSRRCSPSGSLHTRKKNLFGNKKKQWFTTSFCRRSTKPNEKHLGDRFCRLRKSPRPKKLKDRGRGDLAIRGFAICGFDYTQTQKPRKTAIFGVNKTSLGLKFWF